ncbi:MAG: heparinase II/III-family protein [Planctomycetes bacterium]|nr:heparinase II/III-family protein [Planctomycetota bacterium]
MGHAPRPRHAALERFLARGCPGDAAAGGCALSRPPGLPLDCHRRQGGNRSRPHVASLSLRGPGLLVEGGSYAYDASKWRRYVLASEAHNVVLVDGQGQARRGSPRQSYVTDKPLDLAFRSNDRYDYARGVYEEGFGKRDQRPARHTREVLFLKPARLFVVRDTLESRDGQPHLYEALWHLDVNSVEVDADSGAVETHDSGANLCMVASCEQGLRARVVKGQETPTVQGWLPLGHGVRGVRPIPTIVYECRSQETVVLVTVFQPLPDGKEDRVSHLRSAGDTIRIAYASGKSIETTLPPQ